MSMLLSQLLRVLPSAVFAGNANVDVTTLTDDSRRVKSGSLFIAIAGSKADGASFALQALERGALAVVSQLEAPAGKQSQWIQVADAKLARLHLAQEFYGNPFASLQVHGVTGTSGKTTTAFLMEGVLKAAGYKVAMLGTVCSRIGNRSVPAELTTPSLLDLHAFAAEAVAEKCTHFVMEVSSHALDQARVAGMSFDSCLFSNLSRDHLDYHETFEAYFAAKKLLFTQYRRGVAVINVDDSFGLRLANELAAQGVSATKVSRIGAKADVIPSHVIVNEAGLEFTLSPLVLGSVKSHLRGEFNLDNVLLVCGWAIAYKLPEAALRKALLEVQVPGRFEMAFSDGARHVVVDYAHKPDALERVLATARALCKRKLVVVVGCGGDRDHGKRPLMGRIAEDACDVCFVTSDNPRTENPAEIIQAILAGMQKKNHVVIEDRALAIQAACRTLGAGDWLVVAGKGHEDYQIIGTTKHPFDDRKVVREAFGC